MSIAPTRILSEAGFVTIKQASDVAFPMAPV